ncbi:MarR family winged helix-turn-helix transcriptional regulator [Iamia sp.]|jgi:DNA-binding MarR family transcriptional regulator|uniref:MarR family winged helix-turn-helix transcriptional regulator n=1 Tax=Iamia sp. TaxID=2722710 RepID=UPI002B63687C|nr:MarR family transcriptional regulator [Iamia sp.]HXH57015.1 MarR family transcriptional regulator [Iamia sp.]
MTSAPAPRATSPADLAGTAASLRLAVGRLSRRMRQESAVGHSLTGIGILATLDRQGPTTLGELAAAERVAPPTVTKAVAALVADGLIEKIHDPDDRRIHRARLTAAGRQDLAEMRSRRDAWLATRLAALPTNDVDRLAALLPLLEALTADEVDPT